MADMNIISTIDLVGEACGMITTEIILITFSVKNYHLVSLGNFRLKSTRTTIKKFRRNNNATTDNDH